MTNSTIPTRFAYSSFFLPALKSASKQLMRLYFFRRYIKYPNRVNDNPNRTDTIFNTSIIYLQHLTRQLNLLTSISATQHSHLLPETPLDKLPQSDYPLDALEAAESRKAPEIKGFRASYVSFFDINTTVSTVLPFSHKSRLTS